MSAETAATHRIEIDRDKCCGYGACADFCPELYKLDETGFIIDSPGAVPNDLLARARAGADACPEDVIRILAD